MKTSLDFLNKTEKKIIMSFKNDIKNKLKDKIITIKLFGSKVRGNSNEVSDIDIFILVKKKTQIISDIISEIEVDYDIKYSLPISTVLYSQFEYNKNTELKSFFFENVDKEGIEL